MEPKHLRTPHLSLFPTKTFTLGVWDAFIIPTIYQLTDNGEVIPFADLQTQWHLPATEMFTYLRLKGTILTHVHNHHTMPKDKSLPTEGILDRCWTTPGKPKTISLCYKMWESTTPKHNPLCRTKWEEDCSLQLSDDDWVRKTLEKLDKSKLPTTPQTYLMLLFPTDLAREHRQVCAITLLAARNFLVTHWKSHMCPSKSQLCDKIQQYYIYECMTLNNSAKTQKFQNVWKDGKDLYPRLHIPMSRP
ncbi:Hypothetical predicted protein [Pelobates cultripes]|uniref:Uncharacterized protein n=1 Tax=Pelobates cultripes TaxID=61616 RepID=A0AAD1T617_PELCU|nr:Hypothetical predicted protein [Pelobates cultripes]